MLLAPTWIRHLKETVRAAFLAQYNRNLNISDRQLFAFIRQQNFESLDSAVAHFKRAIAYYAERYRFVPTFAHLISSAIPVVEDSEGWERSMYARWPEFQPLFFTPAKSHLSNEVRYAGLFTDPDIIKLVTSFADDIVAAREIVYTRQSLAVLERLMYSLAYNREERSRPYVAAIEACARLKKARVRAREGEGPWSGVHWSKALVRKQQMVLEGKAFSFWELPKLALNDEAVATCFGGRLTPARRATIIEAMSHYASSRAPYVKYLLVCRPNFVLSRDERKAWKGAAPNFFPAYPF